MRDKKSWHGVDLDGTLARQSTDRWVRTVGEPLEPMVKRIRNWLANGERVKIMTARVAKDHDGSMERIIKDWCRKHIGVELPVTNKKDGFMIDLYDDKAVQVAYNKGEPLHPRVGPIRR